MASWHHKANANKDELQKKDIDKDFTHVIALLKNSILNLEKTRNDF